MMNTGNTDSVLVSLATLHWWGMLTYCRSHADNSLSPVWQFSVVVLTLEIWKCRRKETVMYKHSYKMWLFCLNECHEYKIQLIVSVMNDCGLAAVCYWKYPSVSTFEWFLDNNYADNRNLKYVRKYPYTNFHIHAFVQNVFDRFPQMWCEMYVWQWKTSSDFPSASDWN